MADPRRGVYNPVLPLDVLILKELPKEGSTFMGVYPEGASISDLIKVLAEGKLGSPLVSTRLRVLHKFELATPVTVPRSASAAWQVTAKGEQFVREHTPKQEVSDGSS